eukprot:GGOE01018186.1.p1 GENE.GGOE01018186.1~~GGOE01018186.1.p1  ORF type:complete len:436 (+),score=67.77 GGOE01018186.1:22-1329(+)
MELDDPYPGRWKGLESLIGKKIPEEDSHAELKILVIGAGGLGCELLKNLALSGFKSIDVIDMDTIDISNLNRQFLFRQADIGRPKATVAAEFVMRRVPGVQITPHFGAIEEKDDEFYLQFNLVILGLDSLKARQWINDKICSLILWEDKGGEVCEPDDAYIIPMIDGGTEGFKGHVRIIHPTKTASFASTLWMFPPQVAFPVCTVESTPRLPEHCVAYVKDILWTREDPFLGRQVDGDNPEHIQWITKKAQERAAEFGIEGVDYRFTQGVVKNIIPAIASTNAIVAAACVNEALKMASGCAKSLKNYMMYNGNSIDTGIYAHNEELLPEPDDLQAGPPLVVPCAADWTVQDFIEKALVGLQPRGFRGKIADASKVQLYTLNEQIRSTGALAALTAVHSRKSMMDFVPEGPLEHVYLTTPEVGDAGSIFKLKLRTL